MELFHSIRDDEIVRAIGDATKRLVYVAPGVSADVGAALQACMTAGGLDEIVIIVDGDEETCRLGYCDALALEKLSNAMRQSGVVIRRRPGLRLGLVIADEQALVWAPAPLMFESPRTMQEPNGLMLTPESLTTLTKALVGSPDASLAATKIGTVDLTADAVAEVVQAIKAAPPAPFNLSRLSRVFSAKFQFIETVVRGAELTNREFRLDSLIINSDAPESLRPLLQTTIKPFTSDADKVVDVPVLVEWEQVYRKNGDVVTKPTTQVEIRKYWDDLNGRYVLSLPGFGKIIRHADKVKFESGRAAFEVVLAAWVTGFRQMVTSDHEDRVRRVVSLIEQRMRSASPTDQLDKKTIEALVRSGLDKLRVIEPSVKVIYKNITVESTEDDEFLNVLRNALPKDELKGWFKIFDAAPMQQLA